MASSTIPATDPGCVIRCRQPDVYINGARRRDLRVRHWESLQAPDFGRVSLQCVNSSANLASISSLPAIGATLEVRSLTSAAVFTGIITSHATEGEDGQTQVAYAQHQLCDLLKQTLTGMHYNAVSGEPRFADGVPLVFNSGPNTLCSASSVNIDGRSTPVFDASSDARWWTAADAIAYVIAAAVPSAVQVPTFAELQSLAGSIELGRMELTGLSASQALAKLAQRAGLMVRAANEGLGLVIHRQGVGNHRTISLQSAGSKLSLTGSNLFRSRITILRRPSRPTVLALGSAKRYESTFTLQKGWDPSLQSSRWRDFARSSSSDWPSLCDVFRRWVLNEHGWYSGTPWNLAQHDLSSLSASDFFLNSPRRLLPCLSKDPAGQSMGIFVEVRLGNNGSWQPWRGPLWVSRDECAIYLGGDGLPGDYFAAAYSDAAQVRVTACVAADAHVSDEVQGDANVPRLVIEHPHAHAWSIHSSSVLSGVTAQQRNDTAILHQLALRTQEAAAIATEAELELGWVDTSFQTGDVIDRIEGPQLELASTPDAKPSVIAVHHDFGGAQTTRLILRG